MTKPCMEQRKLHAAKLRAQGLVFREIAERLHCNPKTIERWAKELKFQADVAAYSGKLPLAGQDGNAIQVGSDMSDIDTDNLPIIELANLALRRIIRDGSDLSKLKAIQMMLDNEIALESVREDSQPQLPQTLDIPYVPQLGYKTLADFEAMVDAEDRAEDADEDEYIDDEKSKIARRIARRVAA